MIELVEPLFWICDSPAWSVGEGGGFDALASSPGGWIESGDLVDSPFPWLCR